MIPKKARPHNGMGGCRFAAKIMLREIVPL
jgi:hypothetical protein